MTNTPRTDETLEQLETSYRKLQKDIEKSLKHETPIEKYTKNALFYEGLIFVVSGTLGLIFLIIAALTQ